MHSTLRCFGQRDMEDEMTAQVRSQRHDFSQPCQRATVVPLRPRVGGLLMATRTGSICIVALMGVSITAPVFG